MDAKTKFIDVDIPNYEDIVTFKTSFTKEDIRDFVQTFKSGNGLRYDILKNYYNNKSLVDNKPSEDEHIPNHKVKAAMARYISNMATSYFMGVPVSFTTDKKALQEIMGAITTSNTDGNFRYRIAKYCSWAGVGYSLLWRDEQAHFRYNAVDPRTTFVVYDDTVERKPVLGIRIIKIDKNKEKVEVYDDTWKWCYLLEGESFEELVSANGKPVIEEHYMGVMPIIEYANNIDKQADFEPVISEIEAFNISISSTANDIEAFADAYLALVGYNDTTNEDIETLKEDRVLLLDKDGNAFFITKQTDDAMQVNYRKQLINDVHKYSQVPNLSDEDFAGNLSGVAIRFKLIGLDALAGEKEQMMREGIKRELEAIKYHIELRGLLRDNQDIELNTDDYVTVTFHRNLPQNNLEIAQMVQGLMPLVSQETLLSQLPFIDDVTDEMERRKKEIEEDTEPTGLFNRPDTNKVGDDNGNEEEEEANQSR